MGNISCIQYLVGQEIQQFDWIGLSSYQTYTQLKQSDWKSQPTIDLCVQACQFANKDSLLIKLMQKIIDNWSQAYLATNLLIILRHFFVFLFSEGIPYQFIYRSVENIQPSNITGSNQRLVPCIFYFQGDSKTLYVSIPQSNVYDQETQNALLLESIKSKYSEVNDHLLRRNQNLFLTDQEGRQIGVKQIFDHYSQPEGILVNPFQHHSKTFSVMKIYIQTSESDLTSNISNFLLNLIEKLAFADIVNQVQRIQAGIQLVIGLLSSQLYYIDKPIANLEYSSFRLSPTLHLLSRVPIQTAQLFSMMLLDLTCFYWTQTPQTYFQYFFSNKESELKRKVGQEISKQSLMLTALLQTYNLQPNPFMIMSWQISWDIITTVILQQYLLRNSQNLLIQALFYQLVLKNPSFYSYFVSLTEPEKFWQPLCGFLQSCPQDGGHLFSSLIIALIFSQDRIFTRFINTSVSLPAPDWLKSYHIEEISLGSLLFLAMIRLLKVAVRDQREYVYVISSAILFNLAQESSGLHQVVANQFFLLIKALFSKYEKLESNSPQKERYRDALSIVMDLLSKNLQKNKSTALVHQVVCNEKFFYKLDDSDMKSVNTGLLKELAEFFVQNLEEQNFESSMIVCIRRFNFSQEPVYDAFQSTEKFKYEHSPGWEKAMIPYIWSEASNIFPLRNSQKIMLFKVK